MSLYLCLGKSHLRLCIVKLCLIPLESGQASKSRLVGEATDLDSSSGQAPRERRAML